MVVVDILLFAYVLQNIYIHIKHIYTYIDIASVAGRMKGNGCLLCECAPCSCDYVEYFTGLLMDG